MKLKEALKGKLNEKELYILVSSFDVIGDIAIIEIPRELKKKQKIIGRTLLSLLKNVKTVAAKAGGHYGTYRKQKLNILAGEKKLETTHKESGIILKLNTEKCYYSPRMGAERLRIAKQIKTAEKILAVGSGIAPYPLILAKHTPAKITGVEINPTAHKYAVENVKINKLGHRITLIKGDIKKQKGKYDRIISIIPHLGVKLMPTLLKFAKKGTKIHIYDFAPEEDLREPARKLKKIKITKVVKAGQAATRRYRVCIDTIVK